MVTTNEVRSALGGIDSVEFEVSDVAGGIRVALSDDDAGQFFKTVRVHDFNHESKRIGDSIVSHIEAEKSGGLGDLFG